MSIETRHSAGRAAGGLRNEIAAPSRHLLLPRAARTGGHRLSPADPWRSFSSAR